MPGCILLGCPSGVGLGCVHEGGDHRGFEMLTLHALVCMPQDGCVSASKDACYI